MVKDVPHGYDNSVQFNYEKKSLIGREWNTPTTFQVNIRPKVISEAGLEIQPISKKNQPKTKHF
jgi:U3 small nucleolar RNA-associated protein 14